MADRFAALEDRAPKDPGNEQGQGAEAGAEEIVPAVGELALQAEGKDGGQGAEGGGHRLRRRWVGRMPSSVRYLAMVRRATGMPRSLSSSSSVASE